MDPPPPEAPLPARVAGAARSQSLPLALAGGAAAALAFLLIAAAARGGGGGGAGQVDAAILRAIREATGGDAATGALRATMLDLTALGDGATLTLLTALVAGYLLVQRRWALAGAVAGSIASGALAVTLLKLVYARPRPDVVTRLVDVSTASFPSGHAANSALVYVTLGVMLARSHTAHAVRRYLVGTGVALTLAIGCSRVYLGVHWPSDVLAGWIFGAAWAALTGLVVRRLQHDGAIRRD